MDFSNLSINPSDIKEDKEEDKGNEEEQGEEGESIESEFELETPTLATKNKGKGNALKVISDIKAVYATCYYNGATNFVGSLDNSKFKLIS